MRQQTQTTLYRHRQTAQPRAAALNCSVKGVACKWHAAVNQGGGDVRQQTSGAWLASLQALPCLPSPSPSLHACLVFYIFLFYL